MSITIRVKDASIGGFQYVTRLSKANRPASLAIAGAIIVLASAGTAYGLNEHAAASVRAASTNNPSTTVAVKPTAPAIPSAPTASDIQAATGSTGSATEASKPAANPAATPSNQPKTTTPAAKSATKSIAPATAPAPSCAECGGDPDKIPTSTGQLIFSAPEIRVPAGGVNPDALSVRSNTGEAISLPYISYGSSIMLGTSPVGNPPTYEAAKSFSFNASPGTAPGSHTVKLHASGANGGRFYGTLTITIYNP